MNELTRTFYIQGEELHIGGSIGIALFPSDGEDMETLLKCSDVAMYYAKKNGRNNYQFVSPEMNQKTIKMLLSHKDSLVEIRDFMSSKQFGQMVPKLRDTLVHQA